jgi:dihydroxyacetone kinase-like protein
MPITKTTLSNMLFKASTLLVNEADHLSEIDSRFGDGDHGVTIKKIAQVMTTTVSEWDTQSCKEILEVLGTRIMGISGGSAGPLWGTLVGGLALPLPQDAVEIDASILKTMLSTSLDEMESITSARVGDKTMMDSLIPAVQAACLAGDDPCEVLEAAAAAANQGAKDTENYVAKFGRAKNYREQTIGTPDAGATSLAVFFQGLALGVK